ncbi:glycosyltransferase family 4 protein [Chitinispirillales bacterium ANBcel5]|uniref:glycosyltransferase family 4 protein n=1 Tax=Cellulosispirillum alkaliphilum TaxID=3039283 RepID=UPI002A500E38|nr:glycosyltransferase family 4 protein [Chitinispirillales bacterium ANBcel5]
MNLKIALLSDYYWPIVGGVEENVRQTAAQLPEHYQCTIFAHNCTTIHKSLYKKYAAQVKKRETVDPSGKQVVTLFPALNARITLLPLKLWSFPNLKGIRAPELFDTLYRFYQAAFKQQLQGYLKEYDVVHSYSTGYLGRCAAEICETFSIPIVQSPYIHFNRWGDSPAQMSAYNKADAVICHSQDYKRNFVSRSQTPSPLLKVIPPVINEPDEQNATERITDSPYILFLGRKENYKGLNDLLKAFSPIATDFKLVVAGPGEVLGSDERIIDLGSVSETMKHTLLSGCEFLCVPSINETFGIVYAEAMSYAKPVIALDKAPVSEIVQNGRCGILVKPGNSKALRESIEELIHDKKRRERMGSEALKQYRKHFSPSVTIGKLTNLYEEIVLGKTFP